MKVSSNQTKNWETDQLWNFILRLSVKSSISCDGFSLDSWTRTALKIRVLFRNCSLWSLKQIQNKYLSYTECSPENSIRFFHTRAHVFQIGTGGRKVCILPFFIYNLLLTWRILKGTPKRLCQIFYSFSFINPNIAYVSHAMNLHSAIYIRKCNVLCTFFFDSSAL